MKKFAILILLILFFSNIYSQKKDHYWSIGINPLSFAESQLSIGPCIGYRLNKRLEVWTEASYIFSNSYMPNEWKKMQGFRFILQPRYFTGYEKTFFITPEFRLKNFNFDNSHMLINASIHDTLNNYAFRESQTLIAIAVVGGKQVIISRKHNIIMELTFGIGSRNRFINRKNLPSGYEYKIFDQQKHYYIDYETNKYATVSLPIGARFIWNFK